MSMVYLYVTRIKSIIFERHCSGDKHFVSHYLLKCKLCTKKIFGATEYRFRHAVYLQSNTYYCPWKWYLEKSGNILLIILLNPDKTIAVLFNTLTNNCVCFSCYKLWTRSIGWYLLLRIKVICERRIGWKWYSWIKQTTNPEASLLFPFNWKFRTSRSAASFLRESSAYSVSSLVASKTSLNCVVVVLRPRVFFPMKLDCQSIDLKRLRHFHCHQCFRMNHDGTFRVWKI